VEDASHFALIQFAFEHARHHKLLLLRQATDRLHQGSLELLLEKRSSRIGRVF